MKIIVSDIGGCNYGRRYAEVTVEALGHKVDLGVYTIEERIELADHLKEVIEDLLYALPNDTTPEKSTACGPTCPKCGAWLNTTLEVAP